ncbi:tail fiber assembly protein [Pseudomonas sp. URMO17WK12:I12]|uniref:tail fiber assembly protein n=1 Tax=Pseudomonas sp. URMO17WK12:I12 TaxID=1259797 RepID=UPI000484336E|nr:tail fiber assembly protein [Pseudomonas sp. URMO17WK12:I12]
MSVIHVQFADDTEAVVMTVFGCVQGPEIPNQGEIEEEDPRYLSFLESRLPSAKDSAESLLLEKLRNAELNIAPLRYADELGESNDDDQVQLLAWKKYAVALIRVRTQAGFPQIIEWPVAPA